MIRFIVYVGMAMTLVGKMSAREWTSKDGKKVVADLVRVEGDKVILKRKEDGRIYRE